MAMFTGYLELSVNFNTKNRTEKFIILISILYSIYGVLISSQFLLCFLRELIMSFLNIHTYRQTDRHMETFVNNPCRKYKRNWLLISVLKSPLTHFVNPIQFGSSYCIDHKYNKTKLNFTCFFDTVVVFSVRKIDLVLIFYHSWVYSLKRSLFMAAF